MSEAFITGSRAYGKPSLKSDIDLVIRCSKQTRELLEKLSDKMIVQEAGAPKVVRFGRLNLIICTTDDEFATWRVGTSNMIRRNKINPMVFFNRDEAKEVFDEIRGMVGLIDQAQSGDGSGYKGVVVEKVE